MKAALGGVNCDKLRRFFLYWQLLVYMGEVKFGEVLTTRQSTKQGLNLW